MKNALSLLFVLLLCAPSGAAIHVVSNSAELKKALASEKVRPGDVISLRGGTYEGSFKSDVQGTAKAPITITSYPNEWAKIDANSLQSGRIALTIRGAYTIVRDIEFTNSATGRQFNTKGGEKLSRLPGSHLIYVRAPNVKLINLVIHDATHCGIAVQEEAADAEVYGCIIYNNGTGSHEHGIYAAGPSPNLKLIRDNIIWGNASGGIMWRSYNTYNYHVEGNAIFNNGALYDGARNLGIGQDDGYRNVTLLNNYTYQSLPGRNNITISAVAEEKNGLVIWGNIFGGLFKVMKARGLVVEGNTFIGRASVVEHPTGQDASPSFASWNNNTYYVREDTGRPFSWPLRQRQGHKTNRLTFKQWREFTGFDKHSLYFNTAPDKQAVFVLPNKYEPGRAHVVIYNYPLLDTARVDLSGVLEVGQRFRVINTQDPHAAPVLSGTYSGSPVEVPLVGLTTAKPVEEWPGPDVSTGPTYNVFVVRGG